MAILHLNRCKNCRAWRGSPGARSCHMRLRKVPAKDGGTKTVQTLDNVPGTVESPYYGQRTKPGVTCKWFLDNGRRPYRAPPPVTQDAGTFDSAAPDDLAIEPVDIQAGTGQLG